MCNFEYDHQVKSSFCVEIMIYMLLHSTQPYSINTTIS